MSIELALGYFAKWIENETGIIYHDQNIYQLQDRLEQLTRHYNLKDIQELWAKANGAMGAEFRQLLIDISTNNETSFFRDQKFFECLEKKILPGLVEQLGSLQKLKIWSVACSTGQEPYSLAILLNELAEKLRQPPPQILATDISEKVLKKAKSGLYTDLEVGRGLTAALKSKYFTEQPGCGWLLSPRVRDLVTFRHLNLRGDFAIGEKFDLILCRNILIYQRIKAKIEIVDRVTERLMPGGIFLMGAGESLIGISTEFQQTLTDGVSIYRKKAA